MSIDPTYSAEGNKGGLGDGVGVGKEDDELGIYDVVDVYDDEVGVGRNDDVGVGGNDDEGATDDVDDVGVTDDVVDVYDDVVGVGGNDDEGATDDVDVGHAFKDDVDFGLA